MYNDALKLAGAFLVEVLQRELLNQGHKATGDLINSINYKIEGMDLIIQTPKEYVSAMENGLPKGHKVPISALIRWIEIKGIATGEKEIISAAWAIRAAIIREGSPTRGAFKFSKNGRRTGFAAVVIDQYTKQMLEIVQNEVTKDVKAVIFNAVKKINNGNNN